jgi:hypothetical protein
MGKSWKYQGVPSIKGNIKEIFDPITKIWDIHGPWDHISQPGGPTLFITRKADWRGCTV